jgi:hypothetical protein
LSRKRRDGLLRFARNDECARKASLSAPRLNQFRRALIANQSTLIRDQTELDIEARGEILIGKTSDDPIAA